MKHLIVAENSVHFCHNLWPLQYIIIGQNVKSNFKLVIKTVIVENITKKLTKVPQMAIKSQEHVLL